MSTTPNATGQQIERPGSVVDVSAPKYSSSFGPALSAIVFVALVVRVAFAISVRSKKVTGDAVWFRQVATNLTNGKGFVATSVTGSGKLVPTAAHPPIFPFVLAFFDALGIRSADSQRIALAGVSAIGILVLGLLGRRVAGPAVGLVAAGVGAIDPLSFQWGGTLMSESVYLIAIPAALLLALRCIEQATVWRFVALGLMIAVLALIRSEAIDFLALLGVPAVLLTAGAWRQRLVFGLAFLAGCALLLGPWLLRNEIQLGGAVLSDDGGLTLAGSYCSNTFNPKDPTYGGYSHKCIFTRSGGILKDTKPPGKSGAWTELTLNNALTSIAERYARTHLGAMPRIVLAREEAVWGFGNQAFQLRFAMDEGRVRGFEQLGRILDLILFPFVIVGTVGTLRRSWRRFVIIAVPLIVVALNAAIFYGSTRLRVAAEPSLAILAAVGLVAVATWVQGTLDHRSASAGTAS